MLITCTGCNSKIRAPDQAAGKRVKCPKCATISRVPKEDATAEPMTAPADPWGAEPPEPASAPADPWGAEPPAPVDLTREPEPAPADPESFAAATPSSGSARPPVVADEPAPAARSPWDDPEEEEPPAPPKKRKRAYDDDDDDDDFDVRKRTPRRRTRSAEPVNGMAMTSMVLGIMSILTGLPGLIPGCCCGFFSIVALILGGVCLLLGILGKSPGSEGIAWAGIITSSMGILIGLLGLVLLFVFLFAGGGMQDFNRGFNQGFNQGRNINRPPPAPAPGRIRR